MLNSCTGAVSAILDMFKNRIPDDNSFHPYYILYGYLRLLYDRRASAEFRRKKYIDSNPVAQKDLKGAERFFKVHKLDTELLRARLPFLIKELDNDEEAKKRSVQIVSVVMTESNDGGFTSEMLLQVLFGEDQLILTKFRLKEHEDIMEDDMSICASDIGDEIFANSLKEKAIDTAKLRRALSAVVLGQDVAVSEFVQGWFQSEFACAAEAQDHPKASFLFVGPPGVGKSLMAKTAAKTLGQPRMVFNMSEYRSDSSYQGLIGIDSFYKNATEGKLTKFVRENPKCVLIFDEIEKANRAVINLFLQILDQGNLKDIYLNEQVSFERATVVFTSNACRSIYEDASSKRVSLTPKHVIMDALGKEKQPGTNMLFFPQEICSRIASGNVIMFDHIGVHDMMEMVRANFDRVAWELRNELKHKITYDKKLPLLFLFHLGGMLDARIANSQSNRFFKKELYELAMLMEDNYCLMDDVERIHFQIDNASIDHDPDIKKIFGMPPSADVIVVCKDEDREQFRLPRKYRTHFVAALDELEEGRKSKATMAVIDPSVGLKDKGVHGISMADCDSVGMRIFDRMVEKDTVPVFLFESGTISLSEVDKDSLMRRGASGVVSVNYTKKTVKNQIREIIGGLYREEQGEEFKRHGYIIDYSSAQIKEGSKLTILFHSFRKKQALDADNAKQMVLDEDRPKVRFKDIIGAKTAKEQLEHYAQLLSGTGGDEEGKGHLLRGILLYGPPGTGKTMLAKAMAGESKAAFIQKNATDFISKYSGEGEEKIRAMFRLAKRYAPAIIFIDEIDAIGKRRNENDQASAAMLNTLLTEMNGFNDDKDRPVFVLAATNAGIGETNGSGLVLDEALVRRFNIQIRVDLPNEKERAQYLEKKTKEFGFDVRKERIKNLASRMPGLSIAVLENVMELARINAEKQGERPNEEALNDALQEYLYGEKRAYPQEYYERVAIHESGHAYITWLSGTKPSYITIESRGGHGGYTMYESRDDKPGLSKRDYLWRIRTCLAGRAAEMIAFGDEGVSSGAASDLHYATEMAKYMVCNLGMGKGKLAVVPYEQALLSPKGNEYLDAVNEILRQEMTNVRRLVKTGMPHIRELSDKLLQKNYLVSEEILSVLSSVKKGVNEGASARYHMEPVVARECLKDIRKMQGADMFIEFCEGLAGQAEYINDNRLTSTFQRQSYLIAIDDGEGLTTALRSFGMLVNVMGLSYIDWIEEEKLTDDINLRKYGKHLADLVSKRDCIICLDLTQYSGMDQTEFRNFLKRIAELIDSPDLEHNHFFFFRFPYMEEAALREKAECLRDALIIRELIFTPLDMDELRLYCKRELYSRGFRYQDDIWKIFDARIEEQKAGGHFHGLKTVRNIVDEMVLLKAKRASLPGFEHSEDRMIICAKDIAELIDKPSDSPNR